MIHLTCVCLAFVLILGARLSAQTPGAGGDSLSPAAWSIGGISLGVLVDGYSNLNFNHPVDGTNQGRVLDVRANQFSLNLARLSLSHAADPAGFRLDCGVGRAMDLFHFNEPDLSAMKYVEQAFLSWKPMKGNGFQADFGQFTSSAGAESFETPANWNYSRSLLYGWAQPFYHFGLRTSIPVNERFTAGVQLVNGWNNVEDNNTGKTAGFTGTLKLNSLSWTNTYYVGPEKANTNDGLRHLYDTVLLLTPGAKLNMYVNFDYGVDKIASGGERRWVGVTGAARYEVNRWFAVAPRLEWFNDADGFSTGTVQKLKEFTLTGESRLAEGMFIRLEYRRDWSDQPYFSRGKQTANSKDQSTVLVGVVAQFGKN